MNSLIEVVQSEEMFLFVLFQLSLCLFNSPLFSHPAAEGMFIN